MQAIQRYTKAQPGCTQGIMYGIINDGKVAEWFNAPVLKTGVVVGLPRVRLPLFPFASYPNKNVFLFFRLIVYENLRRLIRIWVKSITGLMSV